MKKGLFRKQIPVEDPKRFRSEESGTVVEIELLSSRMFYDTTWLVSVVKNGISVARAKIVRQDTETATNLNRCVRSLSVITNDTLHTLDEKSNIYYD